MASSPFAFITDSTTDTVNKTTSDEIAIGTTNPCTASQNTSSMINNNLEQQIEAILLSFIENTNSNNVKLGDYLYIKGRIGWKGLKKDEYLEHSDFRIINGESLTKAGIDWSRLDIYPNLDTMNPPK